MESYTVYCPLGDCRSAVALDRGEGIYYLKAFDEDPKVRPGYPQPEPADRLGGDIVIDASAKERVYLECSNGHYLEVHICSTDKVRPEKFIVGPITAADTHRCPHCEFQFDIARSFKIPEREQSHKLLSITEERPTGYDEVDTVGRADLITSSRLAARQTCPHCGEYLSFNYQVDG